MRVEITTPPAADAASLAISPDGLKIVETAIYPFWSPDSRSVGFFADGKLKRIDINGGSAAQEGTKLVLDEPREALSTSPPRRT